MTQDDFEGSGAPSSSGFLRRVAILPTGVGEINHQHTTGASTADLSSSANILVVSTGGWRRRHGAVATSWLRHTIVPSKYPQRELQRQNDGGNGAAAKKL